MFYKGVNQVNPIPWIRIEQNNMFDWTAIQPYAMCDRMIDFLNQHITGYDYAFVPKDQETNHWHIYYFTPVHEADPYDEHELHTAGVAEFRRIRGEYSAFEWRMINEADGVPFWYHGLSLRVLESLTIPPPSRDAESWRYDNWRAHGICPPPLYVGMGVTYVVGSDRYPYVITELYANKQSIQVAPVHYHVVSGSEQSGDAVYAFGEPMPGRECLILPSRRHGEAGENIWRTRGEQYPHFVIGQMDAHRDPHK